MSGSTLAAPKYIVAGAGADEFEGTLELGYQIGFPWSLGVGINFSYTTPNILLDERRSFPAARPAGFASSRRTCSPVCRSAPTSVTARVFRKWRRSRWTWRVRSGKVAVSNAHGTVTGAAGGVLLRPFARLISSAGDSVTTYGEPWNMN